MATYIIPAFFVVQTNEDDATEVAAERLMRFNNDQREDETAHPEAPFIRLRFCEASPTTQLDDSAGFPTTLEGLTIDSPQSGKGDVLAVVAYALGQDERGALGITKHEAAERIREVSAAVATQHAAAAELLRCLRSQGITNEELEAAIERLDAALSPAPIAPAPGGAA